VPTTVWSENTRNQTFGISGGTIVWEWHLWDHLVQDYDASHYGTVAASSKLINVNYNAKQIKIDSSQFNRLQCR
jgi:hypothetical protein